MPETSNSEAVIKVNTETDDAREKLIKTVASRMKALEKKLAAFKKTCAKADDEIEEG